MSEQNDIDMNTLDLATIRSLDQAHYLPVFGARQGICLTRGAGVWVYDTDGNKYLDMLGGIAVNVLGHANPELVAAIADQAGKLIHCSNLYFNQPQTLLAAELAELSGLPRVFFVNSGAEANETAFKLARAYFYAQGKPRRKFISARNSFHGRTLATTAATGQAKYGTPFAPLPEGFIHVTYNDSAALTAACDTDTAAIILELIQGESGINPATEEFIATAKECCEKYGILLIIDEIQTGMFRTGRFLCKDYYDVKPDIVTMAKGLAGGVPIGAALCSEAVAAAMSPGLHGTTFGGNPLACAAALRTIEICRRDGLAQAAADAGRYIRVLLTQPKFKPAVVEVRGRGLMLGIGLAEGYAAADVAVALRNRGVLVNAIGSSTIRILPPLILQPADIEFFIDRLAEALTECAPDPEPVDEPAVGSEPESDITSEASIGSDTVPANESESESPAESASYTNSAAARPADCAKTSAPAPDPRDLFQPVTHNEMGHLLHFLDLNDLPPDELANMIRLAEILKNKRRRGSEEPLLAGKTLAMIFTKASTRTRVSFESGMFQLGGSAFFLSDRDIQMGRGETISDTANVLSRLVDAILIRTFSHAEPLELAVRGQVPVINGLTDLQHPTQIIADLLTIKEHLGRLRDFKLAWFGDTNNVANSLIQAAKLPGIEICLAVPEGARCDERCWEQAQVWAEKSGSKLSYTSDPYEAARDAHVFYTDTWVSMGQEAEQEARVKRFADYQVNETLMALGSPEAIFLHCLPAYRGFEVSAEVIDGSQSVVFDQAENRLHAHKAILVSLLAPEAAGSLFHINNGDNAAHGKKYR